MGKVRDFHASKATALQIVIGCIGHTSNCAFAPRFKYDDVYIEEETGKAYFEFKGKKYEIIVKELGDI